LRRWMMLCTALRHCGARARRIYKGQRASSGPPPVGFGGWLAGSNPNGPTQLCHCPRKSERNCGQCGSALGVSAHVWLLERKAVVVPTAESRSRGPVCLFYGVDGGLVGFRRQDSPSLRGDQGQGAGSAQPTLQGFFVIPYGLKGIDTN
jgi:hypothetical protein